MKALLLSLLLVAVCLRADAEEAAISIPDVLNPETRMRAFQQFMLKANPAKVEGLWENFEEFSASHEIVSVSELKAEGEAPRYLLAWEFVITSEEEWDDPVTSADAGNVLPRRSIYYQVFSSNGSSAGDLGGVYNGAIADLNRDGVPEEVVWDSSERRDILSLNTTTSGDDAAQKDPFVIDYLTIKSVGEPRGREAVIIYNSHQVSQARANTWNAQVIDRDKDGIYEVELGPLVDLRSMDVKATIRWDAASMKWIAPAKEAGAHYVLFEGVPAWDAVDAIAKKGGMGYPLTKASPAADSKSNKAEDKSPEEPKPYVHRSFRGRSNREILSFMAAGRTAWELQAVQDQERTAVPELWQLPPKEAAITYVRRNRAPESQSRFMVSAKAIGEEVPPEEGDFTFSDGPSGCFAPGGAFIHHLHCSKEGSFLVYAGALHDWFQTPVTENRVKFDFRKLDLSYEDARHLLQTLWWLSHVRTQPLANRTETGSTQSSTSDGSAAVEITSGETRQSIRAMRLDAFPGRPLGSGDMYGIYDKTAFISLVAKLFATEVPNRFGDAWKQQTPKSHYTEPHSQAELDLLKIRSRELLSLFRQKKVSPAVISQVASAIGAFGWQEFREEVASIPDLLPPLLEHERRSVQIDAELEKMQQTLGDGATRKAYDERERKRMLPQLALAGLDASDTTEPAPEEAGEYAEVDRLYKERGRLQFDSPQWALEISVLRSEVPGTLRQLDSYHDAADLFRLGLENPFFTRFVLSRLKELEPRLAQLLLFMWEVTAETDDHRAYYAENRASLQDDEERGSVIQAPGDLLDERERKEAIAKVTDKDGSYESRTKALQRLVPRSDVHRYPEREIDEALLQVITRAGLGTDHPPNEVAICAALRLGARAWEPLLKHMDTPLGLERLPALTLIAQRNAELREKLQPILAAKLREPDHMIADVLWSLWQLDFRDLDSDVVSSATSSPEEYESERGKTSATQRLLIKQRYHRARHVAALWNEEDPLTRAKLLIAFTTAHARDFEEIREGATERLHSELAKAWPALSHDEQKELRDFTSWCEEHVLTELPGQIQASQLALVIDAVRSALK